MSWKEALTNFFKPKEKVSPEPPKPIEPKRRLGRPSGLDPLPPIMTVEEAVKTLPKDILKDLDEYKSVEGKKHTNSTNKLEENEQLELMEFIARFATMEDINSYFIPTYGKFIAPAAVQQYRKTAKWKPIIKKLREKYLLGEDEVAGRHKRVRLDRADKIFEKALQKDDLKTALQANRDQQEMVEGKNVNAGDVSMTFNQYNVLDDEELRLRIKEAQDKLARKTIDIKPKEIKDGD